MIESPLPREFVARSRQKDLLNNLRARFGEVPAELTAALKAIVEESRLDELVEFAHRCPDLDSFRARLIP